MCDYCPEEFQNEDDTTEELDDGYKRHHHHYHHHHPAESGPISGDRRHEKARRPDIKDVGEYKPHHLSKVYKLTKSRQRKDKDEQGVSNREPVESTLKLLNEKSLDVGNTETTNYGEYKYESMNMEDHGKHLVRSRNDDFN